MTHLLTPIEIEALTLSLRISFWAMLCSLPVAIAVAWLLSRCDFPGKTLVEVVIHLPMVLPPVVVGYLLLLLLGNQGPLGRLLQSWFGITVAFTWKGAAIASA
ncbi:MAG: molybdate ABC transporter permease subunit, partial [Stellaceae bacterium]